MTSASKKLVVLHLGDPIKFNTDILAQLESEFVIIRPSLEERQRAAFLTALKERKWGDFDAIMRPWCI